MFRTLKLKNGDISFDSLGKLNWYEEELSIAQTINIRLMTMYGDLFYSEEFGLNKDYVKNTIRNVETLTPEIQRALIDNEKIIDAELLDVIIYNSNVKDDEGNFLNGRAVLKIAVTLFDYSTLEVSFGVGEDSGI
jgi:hypothetical protein